MLVKNQKLYFVMTIPLRRSNLRELMYRGILTVELKVKILNNLKPIVNDERNNHGDLKVVLLSISFYFLSF